MIDYEIHPAAEIFPAMPKAEYDALKKDIAENGLLEWPVCDPDGRVLDGRHRIKACEELGVDWESVEHAGDPVKFVVSMNIHRRHLTESQRAKVAAKLVNTPNHRPSKRGSIDLLSTDDAASLLNVSTGSVKRASAVDRQGVPALKKAVEQGDMKVSKAAAVAALPKDAQKRVMRHKGDKELLDRAFEEEFVKHEKRTRRLRGGEENARKGAKILQDNPDLMESGPDARKKRKMVYGLGDTIQEILSYPPPDEFAAMIHDHQSHLFDRVDDAAAWLIAFQKTWKRKGAKNGRTKKLA